MKLTCVKSVCVSVYTGLHTLLMFISILILVPYRKLQHLLCNPHAVQKKKEEEKKRNTTNGQTSVSANDLPNVFPVL